LLYVGITANTATRWNHHRYFAAGTWWPAATEKSVQWFDTREEAAKAEVEAIRNEAPLWNSAAAPSSNPRLADRRFVQTTGGLRTEEWGWRNSDVAVYHVLAADIAEGIPAVGDPLPTLASICSRFGVSYGVARSAVQLLVEDGFARIGTARGARRFLVASTQRDSAWRPPALPDGRDALGSILDELRTSPADLSAIARKVGLNISIVRSWGQRHPNIADLIEQAATEGRRKQLQRKLTAGRGKRTDLKDSE
jgi:DNA-binding transcriptional regulator YhcF (GntR family)